MDKEYPLPSLELVASVKFQISAFSVKVSRTTLLILKASLAISYFHKTLELRWAYHNADGTRLNVTGSDGYLIYTETGAKRCHL